MIVLFAFSSGCGQKENKFAPPPPPQVTVSRPLQKPVTDYLELSGNTQAVDQVELQARIEGSLTTIHFKDGDFVKKGDLLFIIEQAQYQAKVQEAEGRVAEAEAQLLRAQEEYDGSSICSRRTLPRSRRWNGGRRSGMPLRRTSKRPRRIWSSRRSVSATPGSPRPLTAGWTGIWWTPATWWAQGSRRPSRTSPAWTRFTPTSA